MKYLIAVLAFLLPTAAFAASLSFSPSALRVAAGETFTLSLLAEPASSTIAGVRAQIAFDPALLEEESFTLAPSWLALVEPGYDEVDNGAGVLIKTAGYPGGITRATPFASVTFKARASGTASIVVAGDTEMLDGDGANQFGGTAGSARIVVAGGATAVPAAPPAPKAGASAVEPRAATSSTAPPSLDATSSAAAPLAGALFPPVVAVLALLIISALAAYGLARPR